LRNSPGILGKKSTQPSTNFCKAGFFPSCSTSSPEQNIKSPRLSGVGFLEFQGLKVWNPGEVPLSPGIDIASDRLVPEDSNWSQFKGKGTGFNF